MRQFAPVHRSSPRDVQRRPSRSAPPATTSPALRYAIGDISIDAPQGAPLPTRYRSTLEPIIGSSLARVRVHTGPLAALWTSRHRAAAVTFGTDIFLAAGAPERTRPRDDRILLHEVAHAVQQRSATVPRELRVGRPSDRWEAEAHGFVSALSLGGLSPRYGEVSGHRRPESSSRPRAGAIRLAASEAQVQRVELSYDDGPDAAGETQKVLDELKKAGARATFYLVGKRVIQGDNWRLVFDIAASGNWLGNHAFDWNDEKDNHIFLSGSREERARKILITEWAIRDALVQGKSDAQKRKTWNGIPQESRDYIDDVIAHGTGRFRTPGFKSKWWRGDERDTIRAIDMTNRILSGAGLRTLSTSDAVDVDPKDWQKGRTRQDIEKGVIGEMGAHSSVLLHSRIAASAAATPAILKRIGEKKWTYTAPSRGALHGVMPAAGFADLSTISDPPTAAQVEQARRFFLKKAKYLGPILSGDAAVSVFQLAQGAGAEQVTAFRDELKNTIINAENFEGPMADWMYENPKFRLLFEFMKYWSAGTPFPREGVTY